MEHALNNKTGVHITSKQEHKTIHTWWIRVKIRDICFMADQVKYYLSGKWIVEKAENVEAYLKELGKPMLSFDR